MPPPSAPAVWVAPTSDGAGTPAGSSRTVEDAREAPALAAAGVEDCAEPPVLPAGYERLEKQPELMAAWHAEVSSRRAEAQRTVHLLDYRDRRVAEEEQSAPHTFRQQAVLKTVHHEAAVLLGMTDHDVRRVLSVAQTAREWLPQVWEQYCLGRLDFARMRKLVAGAGDLIETNSGNSAAQRTLTGALDTQFCSAATGENKNTLDQQVRDFVAEQDPAGHQRRYERAGSQRHVAITHHHNGMSTLRAYLPTLFLADLETRLHSTARRAPRRQGVAGGLKPQPALSPEAPQGPAEEQSTFSQRTADLLAQWLRIGASSGRGDAQGAIPVRPESTINITVPLGTLTGDSEAPAISSDGRYTLPAGEARRLVNSPTARNSYYLTGLTTGPDGAEQVERIVKLGRRNPMQGLSGSAATPDSVENSRWTLHADLVQQIRSRPNLLKTSSAARFVTGNLRAAVMLRDKQCQVHGCTEPASTAEIDHRTSHETGGETSGENSWVLCHHHHEVKSHGLLPGLRTGSDPPGGSTDPPPSWATGTAD